MVQGKKLKCMNRLIHSEYCKFQDLKQTVIKTLQIRLSTLLLDVFQPLLDQRAFSTNRNRTRWISIRRPDGSKFEHSLKESDLFSFNDIFVFDMKTSGDMIGDLVLENTLKGVSSLIRIEDEKNEFGLLSKSDSNLVSR